MDRATRSPRGRRRGVSARRRPRAEFTGWPSIPLDDLDLESATPIAEGDIQEVSKVAINDRTVAEVQFSPALSLKLAGIDDEAIEQLAKRFGINNPPALRAVLEVFVEHREEPAEAYMIWGEQLLAASLEQIEELKSPSER